MQTLQKYVVQWGTPDIFNPHYMNFEIYVERDDEEFERDIVENGIKTPIIVDQEKTIISGHRRWKVAKKHSLMVPYIEKPYETDEERILDLIRYNNYRRKLPIELHHEGSTVKTTIARTARINSLANLKPFQDRHDKFVMSEPIGLVRERVGEVLGISGVQWAKIEYIYDREEKFPKIVERLNRWESEGPYSIHRAYTAIRKIEKFVVVEKEKTQGYLNNNYKAIIKKQDCKDFLNELGSGCADLLITDPPYSTEISDIESFVNYWLYDALDVLKRTGQAYIFIGAYARELRAYLNALNFERSHPWEPQILVWTYRNTIGPTPLTQYKQNWQAILYLRNYDAPELHCESLIDQFSVHDYNAPDGRHSIRHHIWEKPIDLAKKLIQNSSDAEAFVVDPFAGTGTFLLAASELGRKNLGCEIDDEMITLALKRGCTLDG